MVTGGTWRQDSEPKPRNRVDPGARVIAPMGRDACWDLFGLFLLSAECCWLIVVVSGRVVPAWGEESSALGWRVRVDPVPHLVDHDMMAVSYTHLRAHE